MEIKPSLFRFALGSFICCEIIGFCGSHAYSRQTESDARLKIGNLPDSAVLIVNNNRLREDILGNYRVAPGPASVQIEYRGTIKYSNFFMIKEGEEKSIKLDCVNQCASLDVVTDPLGASVYVNGVFTGMTPFFNSFLKPGDYSLRLTLPNYQSIYRSVTLKTQEPMLMTLNLELTPGYQDSLAVVKIGHKKFRQSAQKILFGSLFSILGAGGIYFDASARQKMEKARENADAYDKASSNFNAYREEYYSNRTSAQKDMGTRNILYITASACLIGFSLSFVF